MSVVGLNDVGVCAAEQLVNSEIDNWGTQNPILHLLASVIVKRMRAQEPMSFPSVVLWRVLSPADCQNYIHLLKHIVETLCTCIISRPTPEIEIHFVVFINGR